MAKYRQNQPEKEQLYRPLELDQFR